MSTLAMWLGHYLHAPARQVGRDFEEATREGLSCNVIRMLALAPIAALSSPLGFASSGISWLTTKSRIEVIDLDARGPRKRTLSLFSLNVCFQDAHAAQFAAGVCPPFAPCAGFQTRVEAVVDFVTRQKPDLFFGQEFTDIAAQSAFIEGMKEKGYRFFIVDRAPHPLFNNSGLIIASKYKLTDISFIEFPMSSRHSSCKAVQKGAIRCQIAGIWLLNTHLNGWGRQPEQVREFLIPHFTSPAVLIGDLNFETQDPLQKEAAGLGDFANPFEGRITWTNRRLSTATSPLQQMSIDVMIPNGIELSHPQVFDGNEELTDHFGISTFLEM